MADAVYALLKLEIEMTLAQIGLFGFQFALAILPSSAWLIACRMISGLRRRVAVSYCIAAVLVFLSCIFTRDGLTPTGLLAGAMAGIILGVRWRRALNQRSLEINTIVNYHDYAGK